MRIVLCVLLLVTTAVTAGAAEPREPVTPDASPGAKRLLAFLYERSGQQTLAGQHCAPLMGSTQLPNTIRMAGKYPALFGQDFGFSPPGTWDGINFRQRIVDEAIRRHEEGFVISLMWHAVRPIEQEPVEFGQSVQGDLTDEQWRDLVTPGTEVNERWKSQVDVIAWHLQQLRDAGVPVLWRPYHEMNGDWFWWGKKEGPDGYAKLWRMLFDRLTRFHKLNNLVWVYNANEAVTNPGVNDYATHYPGHDVVDVLATDVYRSGFDRREYDALVELAEGRPVALGEVGAAPSLEVLAEQPRWSWFMVWGAPGGAWNQRGAFRQTLHSEAVLTHDELPWVEVTAPRIHHPLLK